MKEQESPNEQESMEELKGGKELIEYIAKSIVNSPDDVVVTEETSDQGITLKLQVADDDKGRVIGKQGRVAQAMRTLLRVKAAKQGTRATLEIL
ncbi:MAG: KH domain-containing protein [Dehalococcoidia bacterium]|nr:KH domain-containing protein [Dehalococcoidia bacterium]